MADSEGNGPDNQVLTYIQEQKAVADKSRSKIGRRMQEDVGRATPYYLGTLEVERLVRGEEPEEEEEEKESEME
ncbi:MAG: hypothetical protein M1816_006511 [Peltula sp. TS41687]|nr:MAG: hypothetical protein M1816_006511 [Peltula sp. TS41687]